MYPQPTNLSPSTSTSAPKPTAIFEPNSTDKQSTESSPQSSLPCVQRTPAASTSSFSDAPSSHTPPQPFVHSLHQPQIPIPTQHQNPINNKFNIHLLKQMLTSLLSLPFQMKNNSVYPNPQRIARQNAVNNSRGSKMNAFAATATSRSLKKKLSRNSLLFKV